MSEMPSPRRLWTAVLVIVVLSGAGLYAWRTAFPRETTDDAQIAGHVYPVPSRVAGTVQKVLVSEGWRHRPARSRAAWRGRGRGRGRI